MKISIALLATVFAQEEATQEIAQEVAQEEAEVAAPAADERFAEKSLKTGLEATGSHFCTGQSPFENLKSKYRICTVIGQFK